MAPVAVQYCQAIRRHLAGFHAAWPPNVALKLGDFGRVSDGVFVRKSNLTTLGVTWKGRKGSARSTIALAAESGATLALGERGSLGPSGVPLAKASAEVAFSTAGAVLLNAAGCTIDEVEDQVALGRHILDLFSNRQWDDEWCIVTRLVRSSSTTAAVSDRAGARICFEAAGEQPRIDLADASVKLVATSMSNVSAVIVTETGLTPLVGLSRIRKRLFGGAAFGASDLASDDTFALRETLRDLGENVEDHFEFVTL